eukprot:gene40987-50713_t
MSTIVAALVIGGVALSWALLGNLGGMISFGHSAFFGVGAYVSALCSMRLGVPVLPSMLLGGVGAAAASIAMLPVLRLRGPYFALAILAYAHIFRIIATEWTSVTRGAGGLANIPALPTLAGYDFSGKAGATTSTFRPTRSICRKPRADAVHMLAVEPLGQDLVHHPLADFAGGEGGQHLAVGQALRPFRLGGDEAHPQVGGHGLGEAAQVNHPVQLVQRSQARGRLNARSPFTLIKKSSSP